MYGAYLLNDMQKYIIHIKLSYKKYNIIIILNTINFFSFSMQICNMYNVNIGIHLNNILWCITMNDTNLYSVKKK